MNSKTSKIVGLGLLTAIVVVLQAMAAPIRFGVFSVTLVLIPIIVGAALYGAAAGAWLGFVFGIVVIVTDASLFMSVSVPGTIVTCIMKGVLAGLAAGFTYKALEKKNKFVAVLTAAFITPIVNTGVFLLGCRVFFYDLIAEWASAAGTESIVAYMFLGLVGLNFVVEAAVNIVLSTVIVRIIKLGENSLKKR